MKEEKYLLASHDFSKNYLIKTDDKIYKLESQYPNYVRVIKNEEFDNDPFCVDPSGGPMISVGNYINFYDADKKEKVKKITINEEGILIYVE